MSYPSCCGHAETWLKVQVQDHEGISRPELKLNTLITWDSDGWQIEPITDKDWAFVETSLPSIDDLIACKGGGKYHQCDSGPFAGLHKAFSSFGEHYCRFGAKLPLVCGKTPHETFRLTYQIAKPSSQNFTHEISPRTLSNWGNYQE
jgi:hypothetical protein